MKQSEKEFIIKAYSSVPMYIEMAKELGIDINNIKELEELPTITKEQVMLNNSIIANDAIPLMYSNKLIERHTSGSTGKYMNIYWKKSDYNMSMLPLWVKRKKHYGINPDDKMCFFYTMIEVENEHDTYSNKTQLGFSKSKLDDDNLHKVFRQMREFSPKWLQLQPSIGLLLCQFMDKYDIEPISTLTYIEMSGEILTKEARQEIENHFKCKVVDQYGANEFNSIAYECPEGNMHIMESNVIVEILNNGVSVKDNTEGELYITTRWNSAMPLIRYRIGDIGKICTGKCNCGSNWKMFKLTSGRINDYILCEDGSKVTVDVLVRAISAVNQTLDSVIRQFKIVQNDINDFNITLVVDEEDLDSCCEIEEIFRLSVRDERLYGSSYTFEYSTEIINNEENGKLAYFRRNIEWE